MTLWEEFEEYLYERDLLGEDFNHAAVVEDWNITSRDATRYIQSYLRAQTRPNTTTLFVLSRVPGTRTSSSMYHVGDRAKDARATGEQWVSDVMRRIERYTSPTLRRIQDSNPRAVPAAQAIAKSIEASLELMAALLGEDD